MDDSAINYIAHCPAEYKDPLYHPLHNIRSQLRFPALLSTTTSFCGPGNVPSQVLARGSVSRGRISISTHDFHFLFYCLLPGPILFIPIFWKDLN